MNKKRILIMLAVLALLCLLVYSAGAHLEAVRLAHLLAADRARQLAR